MRTLRPFARVCCFCCICISEGMWWWSVTTHRVGHLVLKWLKTRSFIVALGKFLTLVWKHFEVSAPGRVLQTWAWADMGMWSDQGRYMELPANLTHGPKVNRQSWRKPKSRIRQSVHRAT